MEKHSITLYFSIFTDDRFPDFITESIQIEPTTIRRLGEEYSLVNIIKIAKFNRWSYEFICTDIYEFENCFNEFLQIFNGKLEILKNITKTYHTDLVVCLIINEDLKDSVPGIFFTKEQIKILGDLNIEVGIDVIRG